MWTTTFSLLLFSPVSSCWHLHFCQQQNKRRPLSSKHSLGAAMRHPLSAVLLRAFFITVPSNTRTLVCKTQSAFISLIPPQSFHPLFFTDRSVPVTCSHSLQCFRNTQKQEEGVLKPYRSFQFSAVVEGAWKPVAFGGWAWWKPKPLKTYCF